MAKFLGIVIGDLLRRLVSRCLAQTYASHFLSTRAGTEAIVHALTSATEAHPNHTILSVDGIGAYDTISRTSMLEGLREVPDANSCLPFVRQFYAQPSTYVWHDTNGQPHAITQAEGGEQGDPLMPALFSLGQKGALEAVQTNLEEGEGLYAFLDDVYAVSSPHRVRAIYDLLAQHLEARTSIRLNSGKTRIWNTAGHQPANITSLGSEVWVGNMQLPPQQRGITVLGAPVGTREYKQHHLQQLQTEHNTLLQQLPHLQDLQASWWLLLYCASPRCNYQLRMLPPSVTHLLVCSGPRCSRCWLPGRNARLQPTTGYRPCHSPPATPVRRSRTHIGQHTRNASLLGVMGRCLTGSGLTSPAPSSHPPPPVPKRGTAANHPRSCRGRAHSSNMASNHPLGTNSSTTNRYLQTHTHMKDPT